MLSQGEEEPRLRAVGMVFTGHQDRRRGPEKDGCVGTGLEGNGFGAVRPPQGGEARKRWDRLDHGSWACGAPANSRRGPSRADHPLPSHLSPWRVPSLAGTVAL